MPYCGDCGSENSEGKKFCWKCGAPLHAEGAKRSGSEGRSTEGVSKLPGAAAAVSVSPFQGCTPASLGSRIAAFLVDAIVISLLYIILSLLLPIDSASAGTGIAFAYFALLWGLTGTSLGKEVVGIRLAKKDGTSPGFVRAIVRAFVMFFLAPLWITWWPALFRKDSRALHDLAAGTMVVKPKNQQGNAAVFVAVLAALVAVLWAALDPSTPVRRSVNELAWDSKALERLSGEISQLSAPQVRTTPTNIPRSTLAPATVPSPTSTSTPSASQIASVAPSPAPTSEMLMYDFLIDNRNGWEESADAYFSDKHYHVQETDAGYSHWATCRECAGFSDVVYEALISKVEGPDDYGYGIAFRRTAKGGGYVFQVTGNGGWNFAEFSSSWREIIPFRPSEAIRTGNNTNKLRVIARGSDFSFYVNDQFLGSAVDNTYSMGFLGAGVGKVGLHITLEYVLAWKPNAETANKLRPTLPIRSTPGPPTPTVWWNVQAPVSTAIVAPLAPPIPPGMGGLIVSHEYGDEMNYDIGGKLYKIPPGGREYIYLPPGTYTFSWNTAREHLRPLCDTANGCTVEITEGKYFRQNWILVQ